MIKQNDFDRNACPSLGPHANIFTEYINNHDVFSISWEKHIFALVKIYFRWWNLFPSYEQQKV